MGILLESESFLVECHGSWVLSDDSKGSISRVATTPLQKSHMREL